MARSRSAKDLAQRIERDYFKRRRGPRRALSWLGLAATVGSLGLVAVWLMPSQRLVWSKGSVRPAHAFIEHDCGACHGPILDDQGNDGARAAGKAELVPLGSHAGQFGAVNEAKCSRCHAGSAHHATGPTPPSCTSCHEEHAPLHSAGKECTSCHSQLSQVWPATTFGAVTGFPEGHPEFAALGKADPTTLSLNHDVHSWPGLRGPNGPEPLSCASCHEPDGSGRGFQPVRHAPHCARCHTLELAGRPELGAPPHGDVELLSAHLRGRVDANQVDAVLKEFGEKVCRRCHELGQPSAQAPLSIRSVALSRSFLPNARFAHRSHRELGCGACHSAELSRRSEDLLLPGVARCGQCHGASSSGRGAPSECPDCHRYHSSDASPYGPGPFTLPE